MSVNKGAVCGFSIPLNVNVVHEILFCLALNMSS